MSSISNTLVLFTNSYPYNVITEKAFIIPEIPVLATSFDRVIVVPMERPANNNALEVLPPNVSCDLSLPEAFCTNDKRNCLRGMLFRSEWLHELGNFKDRRQLMSLWRYCGRLASFHRWLVQFLERNQISLEETVFYTFWFHIAADGLAYYSQKVHPLTIVSRAHGFDIYDERVTFRSHYCRQRTLREMRRLYTASQAGCEYLQRQFPEFANKITVAHLGTDISLNPVEAPATISPIRLVSCARLHPVKQLPKFLQILIETARLIPETIINYQIIGMGSDEEKLKRLISNAPQNLHVTLLGEYSHDDVLNFYKKNPIHFHILPSQCEGIPLSIAETMEMGIPSIATAVGGIPELIRHGENGFLLSDDYSPAELKNILMIIHDKQKYNAIRCSAHQYIEENFDQKMLRENFVKHITVISQLKA